MRRVVVIAQNSFQELIRDRILYSILVIAVIFVLFSLALGQLSFTEQIRITLDFGLAGIELSVLILSIFTGSTIVFREIERRTIFTVLSHPVSRSEFLLGKFFGLLGVLLLSMFLLGTVETLILLALGWSFDPNFLVVLLGFLFEGAVLVALTMCLGTFVRPTLSVALSIAILIIGRTGESLKKLSERDDSETLKFISSVIEYTFPNFNRWNWKSFIGYDNFLTPHQVGFEFLYCLSWLLVLLTLTVLIFRRKEFV